MRLSPFALSRSLTADPNENSPIHYSPGNKETRHLSFKGKILNWPEYYWVSDAGKALWAGRIFLFLAVLAGIMLAADDYRRSINKTATLAFPFNIVLKFFLFLVVAGLACVAFSYVIGLFLLIGAGIVLFCSGIHTIGGFTLLPWEETRSQVSDQAKQKVISYLSPYFFRKKK